MKGSSSRRRFKRKKAVIDIDPTEDEVVVDAATSEVPLGLLYKIMKNLALSGVGRIVLVYDNDENDTFVDIGYFDGSLDDLGAAYCCAVLTEINGIDNYCHGDDDTGYEDEVGKCETINKFSDDGALTLEEYICQLNPGVQVNVVERTALMNGLRGNRKKYVLRKESGVEDASDDDKPYNNYVVLSLGDRPIVVCIDRSTTLQLKMNDACRN